MAALDRIQKIASHLNPPKPMKVRSAAGTGMAGAVAGSQQNRHSSTA